MIKYAKVIDETSGLCQASTGTNEEKYQEMGFEQLDVTQSPIDSQYYLTSVFEVMSQTPEYIAEQRALEIEQLKKEYLAKYDAITSQRVIDKNYYECGIITEEVFNARETVNKNALLAGWNEFWSLSGLTPPTIGV